MSPSGLDAAWGKPNPAGAFKAGVRVISLYLSWDSSKNVTPDWVKRYHAAGIGVLLNWESQPGAPLNGAAQGRKDATEAVRQARALLHAVGQTPKNKLSISFSCDRDVNASQYHALDAYYGATKTITHAAGMLNGMYGEADLVHHLHAAGLTDMEWQTYAWSRGRLDAQADYYQYDNGHVLAGGSVDYDRIIHVDSLGAWWPAASAHNKPAGGSTPAAPVTHHPFPFPYANGSHDVFGNIHNPSAHVHGGVSAFERARIGPIKARMDALGFINLAQRKEDGAGVWGKEMDAACLRFERKQGFGDPDKLMGRGSYDALMSPHAKKA